DLNSGEGSNFRIERTLNPGTYYLRVNGNLGDYQVWIEGPGAPLVTDDHGYSWYSSTNVTVG
ncbi:MAG: hypothetical protein AAB131_19420, partial [Actinomycetota bacterium]